MTVEGNRRVGADHVEGGRARRRGFGLAPGEAPHVKIGLLISVPRFVDVHGQRLERPLDGAENLRAPWAGRGENNFGQSEHLVCYNKNHSQSWTRLVYLKSLN